MLFGGEMKPIKNKTPPPSPPLFDLDAKQQFDFGNNSSKNSKDSILAQLRNGLDILHPFTDSALITLSPLECYVPTRL